MNINICFGINNDYCQHCGVTIASILYNSNTKDNYNFFIITDYLSEENISLLEQLKSIRRFKLNVLTISAKEFQDLKVNNDLGASTFFRFKAFELLKCRKVIYLDCDIVVRKDIAELYNTNIDGYYCAGVEDVVAPVMIETLGLSPTTLYINAGVMLINLKYCKENKVPERLKEFVTQTWQRAWNDQEIINYIFQNGIKGVDYTWNCMYGYINHYKDTAHFAEVAKSPAIIHYITKKKPWVPGMAPYMKADYFRYLRLTPWFLDFTFAYQIEEQALIFKKLDEIKKQLMDLKNS